MPMMMGGYDPMSLNQGYTEIIVRKQNTHTYTQSLFACSTSQNCMLKTKSGPECFVCSLAEIGGLLLNPKPT